MYDSLFFVGLEPSSGRKRTSGSRKMRRPSKSPFSTPAEQVGQQFIQEELVDSTEVDDGYEEDDVGRNDDKYLRDQEIEELEMYISDLQEEIGVIDVTLVAAEGSGETETALYKQKMKEMNKLRRNLIEAERDVETLLNWKEKR